MVLFSVSLRYFLMSTGNNIRCIIYVCATNVKNVVIPLVFVRWFGGLEYGKWKRESGACSFRTHRTLYYQFSPDIKGAMWSCIVGE